MIKLLLFPKIKFDKNWVFLPLAKEGLQGSGSNLGLSEGIFKIRICARNLKINFKILSDNIFQRVNIYVMDVQKKTTFDISLTLGLKSL